MADDFDQLPTGQRNLVVPGRFNSMPACSKIQSGDHDLFHNLLNYKLEKRCLTTRKIGYVLLG